MRGPPGGPIAASTSWLPTRNVVALGAANDGASWQHAQLEKLPVRRFVGRQRVGFDTHPGGRCSCLRSGAVCSGASAKIRRSPQLGLCWISIVLSFTAIANFVLRRSGVAILKILLILHYTRFPRRLGWYRVFCLVGHACCLASRFGGTSRDRYSRCPTCFRETT